MKRGPIKWPLPDAAIIKAGARVGSRVGTLATTLETRVIYSADSETRTLSTDGADVVVPANAVITLDGDAAVFGDLAMLEKIAITRVGGVITAIAASSDYINSVLCLNDNGLVTVALSGFEFGILPPKLCKNFVTLESFNCNGNLFAAIASDFFADSSSLVNIYIPDNLFVALPSLAACEALEHFDAGSNPYTVVPTGYHDNNPALLDTDFSGTGITTLPAGLLDNCPLLTAFYCHDARSLVEVPEGLVDNNHALVVLSMEGCSLPSAMVDRLLVSAAASGGPVVVTIQQTPAAPPGAAGLAAITTIQANGGSVACDT